MLHYDGSSRKVVVVMSKIPAFQPINTIPTESLKRVRVLLADIDDTLTTDGRLTAEAFGAMERLESASIAVAPVTGRPAGWCDHIARMWPVAGVIGENGAFYFSYSRGDRSMHRVYAQNDATRTANHKHLKALATDILAAVPGAAISADQFTRQVDLAIDFCEDVPPLSEIEIARIVKHFEAAGATAKISSIHVNGWFGDHDKFTMAQRFLADVLSIDPTVENDSVAYIGDSPNDEQMWAHFALGVGVANANRYRAQLTAPPAYVATREGGCGFAEFADILLTAVR